MKKILTVACVAAFSAGFADEITCGNQMGVLEISSTKANCIVAVPFAALGGGDVAVSNIVKTANLTVGDKLYTFTPGATKTAETWEAWTLAGNSTDGMYWQSVGTASLGSNGLPSVGETTSPDTATIVPCAAFILNRQNASTSPTFYVYGDYQSSLEISVSTNLTLVANPLNESVDILKKISSPSAGDTIYVLGDTDSAKPTQYRYSTKNGWAMVTFPATFTPVSTLELAPGTGVWVKLAEDNTFKFR